MVFLLSLGLFFVGVVGLSVRDMLKPKPLSDPLLDARRRRFDAARGVITSFYVGESYRRHLRALSPLEQRQVQSDLMVIATSWSNAVGEQQSADTSHDVWTL